MNNKIAGYPFIRTTLHRSPVSTPAGEQTQPSFIRYRFDFRSPFLFFVLVLFLSTSAPLSSWTAEILELALPDDEQALLKKEEIPAGFLHGQGDDTVDLTPAERAWLKAHPDIELGFNDAFEPTVIVQPDGSLRGTLVDILDRLNTRLGTHITLRIDTIPVMFEKAKTRETDGLALVLPEKADELGLLKTHTFYRSYPTIFGPVDASFDHPDHFIGKKVAIIDKPLFSKIIIQPYKDRVTILKVKDPLAGLELIQQKKADLFIGMSPNNYLITKHRFFGIAAKYVFYESLNKFGIAIRPDWPELIPILNKGLAVFSEQEIDTIVERWVNIPVPEKTIQLTYAEQEWLAQNHTVRVRVVDFPPFIIARKGKEPSGITIDLLNLIARRTGIKFKYDFSTLPFAEALKRMKNREGPDLIATMMRTVDREKTLSFSKDYLAIPRVIFTRTDGPFIAGMEDLSGKTIAVPRGTQLQEQFKMRYSNIRLLLFATDLQALQALATGQADAYVGNLTLASYLIRQKAFNNLKVAAPSPFGKHALSCGNRKDWPELSSIISKGLDTITREEQSGIHNKYLSVRYEHGITVKDVLTWILLVAGAASGVVLVFVFWNRSLIKQVNKRTSTLMISNKSLQTEIDRRKKVEDSLRDRHDFLNNLTNSMVDVVFSVRMPEREIEWLNDSFKIFGYEPDDCIGKTTEFLYRDRAAFLSSRNILAEFITDDDRDILHTQQMYKKKDGELFPADLTISKHKVNKKVVSITGIIRDITERKKAERELKRYQERLKALSSQLILAEEKERNRIAADLHDHIGQALAFSRIQVARAKKYAPEGKLATILDGISLSLLHTIQEVKGLIFDLSPPLLHEIGLAAAISNWLEDEVGRKNSIMVKFIHSGKELSLEKDMRSIIFRNVRELLYNVIKHAQATEVVVSLVKNTEELMIIVRDNGRGFDPDGHADLVGIDSGFGLFSVKQQIEDFGGTLEIESRPGKGCKVTLTAPINNEC